MASITSPRAPSARRAAVVYVGLGLGQRAISFVLIPFLTIALSPSEYGTIAVLTSISAFLTILFGLGLETAVFRSAVLDKDGSDSSTLRSTARYLRLWVPLAGTILAAGSWALGVTVADAPTWAFASALFTAALSPAVYSFALPALRGGERLRPFIALAGSSIASQVTLTVVLVIVLDLGLLGWAVSSAVSAGLAFLAGGVLARVPSAGDPSWAALRSSLRFTLPLVPHHALHWATAFVDRLIMIAVLGAAATGVYSLSYQAAVVVGLVLTELNRALMPNYARLGSPASPEVLVALVRRHFAAMSVVTAAALLVMPLAGPLLFRGDYAESAHYLGTLIVAQFIFACYSIPTNLLTLARGQSARIWRASGVSAAVNVLLNLALLFVWGVWGAVAATVLAYVALLAVALRLEARSRGELSFLWHRPFASSAGWIAFALAAGTAAPFLPGVLSVVATGICATVMVLGPGRELLGSSGSPWLRHPRRSARL